MSLIVLVAILLILVILAQNSKGGGLSSQFGGSGASNMIGVKKTGDLLERLTWGLSVLLMVLALSSSFLLGGNTGPTDDFVDRARQEQQPVQGPALDLGGEEGAGNTEAPGNGSLDDLGDLEADDSEE